MVWKRIRAGSVAFAFASARRRRGMPSAIPARCPPASDDPKVCKSQNLPQIGWRGWGAENRPGTWSRQKLRHPRRFDDCPYAHECATQQPASPTEHKRIRHATTDEPFFWMVWKRIRAESVAFASARQAGAGGRLHSYPPGAPPTPPCAGKAKHMSSSAASFTAKLRSATAFASTFRVNLVSVRTWVQPDLSAKDRSPLETASFHSFNRIN